MKFPRRRCARAAALSRRQTSEAETCAASLSTSTMRVPSPGALGAALQNAWLQLQGAGPRVLQIREISTSAVAGGVTEERRCRALRHGHCPVPSPSEPVRAELCLVGRPLMPVAALTQLRSSPGRVPELLGTAEMVACVCCPCDQAGRWSEPPMPAPRPTPPRHYPRRCKDGGLCQGTGSGSSRCPGGRSPQSPRALCRSQPPEMEGC